MREVTIPADIRLEGPGGEFLSTAVAWQELLGIAIDFGWDSEHEPVLYAADVGLEVGAEDAAGLAGGLEAALADRAESDEGFTLLGDPIDYNPDGVRELIAFCRAGGFRVC